MVAFGSSRLISTSGSWKKERTTKTVNLLMKQFALTMPKVLTSKNQEIPNCSARNYVLSVGRKDETESVT